jgi:hypothetical protein
MEQKTAELSLFTESELSGIQPTGSPWVLSDVDPATVPVPLQVVIRNVTGPYTARDRKLWTFLLHVAFDELGKKGGSSVKISDINSVFRSLGGEHSTTWIWESAKRLAQTTIEFETTLGDQRYDTVTSLFYATVPRKGRRGNELHFGFPEPLIPIIKEPLRFARLRVHFLIKLSGKYAVTLYEILEGYANRRDGECRVSIEDLRMWLKVPEGTYEDWRDFRKRVLKPAVDQINADPLGAGFSVEYKPIRKGRKIGEVVFKLTKTDARKTTERMLKGKAKTAKKAKAANEQGRPLLRDAAIDEARHKTNYTLDMDEMQAQFWEYWESKGRQPFNKGADAAFIGFCVAKYKQNTT